MWSQACPRRALPNTHGLHGPSGPTGSTGPAGLMITDLIHGDKKTLLWYLNKDGQIRTDWKLGLLLTTILRRKLGARVLNNTKYIPDSFYIDYSAFKYIYIYITLHYITLHYITLHYITLHYITLHYITYIHPYIHTSIHPYIYIYIYTYIYIYIHRHTYIQTCRHADIQTYRQTNRQTCIHGMHACMHACIHTYS